MTQDPRTEEIWAEEPGYRIGVMAEPQGKATLMVTKVRAGTDARPVEQYHLTIGSDRRERLADVLRPQSDTRDWLIASRLRLIEVLKLAYRKHVCDDDAIGWAALEESLQTELSEAMGDERFQQWLSRLRDDGEVT